MGSLSVRSLSFLSLDDFEGNANISVAIKSGSTVVVVLALVVLLIVECKHSQGIMH